MANLFPTFRINGQRLWLDVEPYVASGSSGDNTLHLAAWCLGEPCERCGEDIASSGYLMGNPGRRSTPGDDDCVVVCDCGETYQVEWRYDRVSTLPLPIVE